MKEVADVVRRETGAVFQGVVRGEALFDDVDAVLYRD